MALMNRRAENGYPERIFSNYKYKSPSVIRDRNGTIIRAYFYCVNRDCNGSGIKQNDVFTLNQAHNHNPDLTLDASDTIDRELFNVVTRSFTELGTIYENFLTMHEDITRLWDRSQKMKQMNYWRSIGRLPNVQNSMTTLYDCLFTDEWKTLRTCAADFLDVDIYNDEVLLFKHPEVLVQLERPDTLVINVSDKILPSLIPVGLLITVQAVLSSEDGRRKKRAVPCMWFLLRDKNAGAFQFVARSINRNFGHFITSIQTNGDADLDKELNNYDLHPTITLFTFAKIIFKRAREFGLDMVDDRVRTIVHDLISLSLLPETSIRSQFDRIANNAAQYEELIMYYRNTWIGEQNGRINKICFFDKWDALAEPQRNYENLMGTAFRNNLEPSIFKFIGFLINANEKILKDIHTYKAGGQPQGTFTFIMKPSFNEVAVKNIFRNLGRENELPRVIQRLSNSLDELFRNIASNHADFPIYFREVILEDDSDDEGEDDIPAEEIQRVEEVGADYENDQAPTIVSCVVCQIRRPNRVLLNCGHLLCDGCRVRITERCPVCRQNIDATLPIFF